MISAENLYKHVEHLSHGIGVRLAGSPQERQAAEYLKEQFLQYVPKCEIEEFPVKYRRVEHEELSICIDGKWEKYAATLFNAAPTTHGQTLEAELVFFDPHSEYQREDLSYLRGKAVIHYGLSFGSEDNYRRMVEAKPAFLLMVDTRYTNTIPLNDGLLPAYDKRYGSLPMMSVAFFDAWKWCTEKATHARLTVAGETEMSKSSNVIAELPGTDPEGYCLYVSGHTDSVANSPGADDNAIGCAITLEMARVLSQKKLRHTVRFITFGAEEQLSVGCAEYVRAHREEVAAKGKFMFNFDSCGSAVGWNKFVINAAEPLRKKIEKVYHSHDIYYLSHMTPDPCTDMFPFTVAGVPGVMAIRYNCEAGKFFHHRVDNDLPVMSVEYAAKLAQVAAELIEEWANSDLTDFPGTEPATKEAVADVWENWYGGW